MKKKFLILSALTSALSVVLGCGDGYLSNLNQKCSIASNQTGSLMPPIGNGAVQVFGDSNFTDDERAKLQSAVDQWNQTGMFLRGDAFFSLSFADVPSSVQTADPRNCNTTFGSPNSFYVVRETDNVRWSSLGFNANIPGVTLRCQGGNNVSQQVVLFNASIIDPDQFKSIALHELGHSLGLDHSCSSTADSSSFVGCTHILDDNPYHQAVMYPSLRARLSPNDAPEIKEILRDNDTERAKCLYNPQ